MSQEATELIDYIYQSTASDSSLNEAFRLNFMSFNSYGCQLVARFKLFDNLISMVEEKNSITNYYHNGLMNQQQEQELEEQEDEGRQELQRQQEQEQIPYYHNNIVNGNGNNNIEEWDDPTDKKLISFLRGISNKSKNVLFAAGSVDGKTLDTFLTRKQKALLITPNKEDDGNALRFFSGK